MGINLVCQEYGTSLPSIRVTSQIGLLTATLADKDNPSLKHYYQTIRQIAKKLLLKGSPNSFLTARSGIYSACMYSVCKSHSQNSNIK